MDCSQCSKISNFYSQIYSAFFKVYGSDTKQLVFSSMDYLHDLFSVEGNVAVVTGASRGLGRAAAIALGSAGARTVLIGRDADSLAETQSLLPKDSSFIIEANVASDDEREMAITKTIETFGTIDILVNNAGIIRRNPVLEYTAEDWDAVIETDLTAVFRWSQSVAKIMKANGKGKIINIASLLSFSGGVNAVAYAAAKGGVAQITKAMANELAKEHINVNAIAPGYFETDATELVRNNPERMKQLVSRIPTGRFGKPDELAGAFIFLASKASDYVNGHILSVDGGFNAY